MRHEDLLEARERLLAHAVSDLKSRPGVLGVFLGGSLPAGSADQYSDIDLRVVVTEESHPAFVAERREIPKPWPGFLFNEWLPGAQHCVSHFRPLGKIDIFYRPVTALAPSPWLGLPIRVLHDPHGIVAVLIERSQGLGFEVAEEDVDFSISKGLAAAHETWRRAMRGELFYAQTLLDELRQHMMRADDWLHDKTPATALLAKFDQRGSEKVRKSLAASYCPCDAAAILSALCSLAELYREQVTGLHQKFRLSRPMANDIAALDAIRR